MIKFKKINTVFGANIWRVFIAGSSGSGKTFFAKNLLENNLFDFSAVFFYHPDLGKSLYVKFREK